MKKILSAAVAVLLLLSLAACSFPHENQSADTEEPVTIPPITIPDEPDDRVFTDTTPYAERLESLFASNPVAPAEDFTYEVADDGVTVTAYTGGDIVVVIPDTIEDQPVVAIGEGAFADKTGLKAVSVPDTVRSIAAGAFAGCKNLTSLRTPVFTCEGADYFGALFGAKSYDAQGSAVPAGLSTLVLTGGDTIPDYAFYACRALEAVAIPETVTEIGSFAFYGCEALVYIPLGHTALTAIGEHAFTNCADLLGLELPATVESLGFAMLEGCAALTDLTIPFVGAARNGVASETETEKGEEEEEEEEEEETLSADHLAYIFGARAYVHASGYVPASLVRVTLLAGCGDIPANAFFECDAIREVVIPDGVTAIGHRAFYGCERLATVTLPDSVTAIGDDAFNGCIRLASVDVGMGLKTLGVQAFMGCVSLPEMTLPATVKAIPNAAFAGCTSFATLTAPGVTEVGAQAFRHCDKLLGWAQ